MTRTNTNGNHGPATAREENALSTREEHGRELTTAHEAAAAQYEIQGCITIALKFPRNEDEAYGALMKSCQRPSFAEKASYKFPRGGQDIKGPSAHLAREAGRVWKNIRYGFEIIRDDDTNIHLRGWAWDMQTNTRVTQDAHFKKLVFRKKGGWVIPDERDLRELVNKHGSIAERNCLLKLIPSDFIEDAMGTAAQTLRGDTAQDIDGHRKRMIVAFAGLNVSVGDLEGYLGNPLKQASPDQIADLRTIFKSIQDGQSRWSDYVRSDDDKAAPAPVHAEATMDDLTGGDIDQSHDRPQEDTPLDLDLLATADAAFAADVESQDRRAIGKHEEELRVRAQDDATRTAISAKAEEARAKCPAKKAQKDLAGTT